MQVLGAAYDLDLRCSVGMWDLDSLTMDAAKLYIGDAGSRHWTIRKSPKGDSHHTYSSGWARLTQEPPVKSRTPGWAGLSHRKDCFALGETQLSACI